MTEVDFKDLETRLALARAQVPHVEIVEQRSSEMLSMLNNNDKSQGFVKKVLKLSDSSNQAAQIVDSQLSYIENSLPLDEISTNLEQRKAWALKVLEQENAMQDTSSCTKDLQSVLDHVRLISGLEISCREYLIENFSLLDDPKAKITDDISRASEIVLEAPNSFRAHVSLRSGNDPYPQAVAVYSVDEKDSTKDAFGNPDYIVFRRISAIADQALSYFRQEAGSAAQSSTLILLHLLLWLASYKNLFEEPCAILGSYLACDTASLSLIPPIFRTFKKDIKDLRLSAFSCKAYHLHTVPEHLL